MEYIETKLLYKKPALTIPLLAAHRHSRVGQNRAKQTAQLQLGYLERREPIGDKNGPFSTICVSLKSRRRQMRSQRRRGLKLSPGKPQRRPDFSFSSFKLYDCLNVHLSKSQFHKVPTAEFETVRTALEACTGLLLIKVDVLSCCFLPKVFEEDS